MDAPADVASTAVARAMRRFLNRRFLLKVVAVAVFAREIFPRLDARRLAWMWIALILAWYVQTGVAIFLGA